MKPLLLGFSGKAEHGKTASARITKEFVEGDGGIASIHEISTLIRLECIAEGLLPEGITREEMNREQLAVLIKKGNDRRAENPTYWTDTIVAAMLNSGSNVAICPNLRFTQEADAIRNAGGYITRVNRLNANRTPFISLTRDPNDITETGLDYWAADFYITNVTGHNKLLERNVTAVYEHILDLEAGIL